MTKVDEELLTTEFIDHLKKTDQRFVDLDVRLKIEQELRDSICFKVIREACSEDAAVALEQLAYVDPTDVKAITGLQCRVQRARFIARTLNRLIERGEMAEQSINEEQAVFLNQDKGENV